MRVLRGNNAAIEPRNCLVAFCSGIHNAAQNLIRIPSGRPGLRTKNIFQSFIVISPERQSVLTVGDESGDLECSVCQSLSGLLYLQGPGA